MMKFSRLLSLGVVLSALLLVPQLGLGAGSAMPFTDGFESGTPGAGVPGNNGWTGDTSTSAVYFATNYTYGGVLPLPDPHTQVAALGSGLMTNVFETVSAATNVWIDFMIKTDSRGEPDTDADVQAGLFFDVNGAPVVYSGYYNESFVAQTPKWTVLEGSGNTGKWVRVSIVMDYKTDDYGAFGDAFFKIALDGGAWLTNAIAFNTLPPGGPEDFGGEWFLCGNSADGSPIAGSTEYLTSIETAGPGFLDDVVVSNDQVSAGITDKGVPLDWLGGSDQDDDDDGDGVLNWEEYYAGTDKDDSNSLFRVTEEVKMGASNKVVFVNSPNTGSTDPFIMERSTDLTAAGGGWAEVDTITPRDASGTNTWYDMAPPAGAAYYRPKATHVW